MVIRWRIILPADGQLSFFFGWPHGTQFQQLIAVGVIAGEALTMGAAMRDLTGLYPMIAVRSSRRGFTRIVYRELGQLWLTFALITCLTAFPWVGFQPLWWLANTLLLGITMLFFTQPRMDWAAVEFCVGVCAWRLLIQFLILGW
ncbi:hypothetical protein [Schleiferilactobacillus shenzhenensis]|uniref:Uncharacterized protein n=1 Tax=Schleiferilactobacillus shenzhenensis LY-73 TaxID=1231336 RepID=U4TJN0_9LACO|nr:hypothetical protein [Schleiferilactobacillus shenzhenensis]ERL64414.1 hypothetical protein L248_0956 [Schleiferilactobacillus shenzhenensis LY-73]